MDSKRIVGLILVACTYIVLSVVTIYSVFFAGSAPQSTAVALICIIGMVVISIVAMTFSNSSAHIKARQSNRVFDISNQMVGFIRPGFDQESAQQITDLLLRNVTAVSVAITDRENILGFSGVDRVNHEPGTPIRTQVTMQTVSDGKQRVVETANALGFVGDGAKIKGAIITPLIVQDNIIGTLKFYYTNVGKMDEDQVAMAEGFAKLLSTQIAASLLDHQTEVATKMELRALQAQINPHFLFNTINTIASYTRTDPEKARKMLREFAIYYRRLLENSEDLIPLSSEVEQTERYLMFQRARFGEESVVMDTIISPEVRGVRVPAFIIQPLVENAVGHARREDGSPLHITVRAYVKGSNMFVDVSDDGVGIPAEKLPNIVQGGSKTGMGIALKNVNQRLEGYFGTSSGLGVSSVLGKGTKVQLIIAGVAQEEPQESSIL